MDWKLSIDGLITLVVGLFVFVSYKISKRDERKNAAAIIIMDIRHAESVVSSIIERNAVDLAMKNILYENNWAKYKHLFVSDMASDDFMLFNRFFDACVDIYDAKKRMNDVFQHSLLVKAEILQSKMYDLDFDSDEFPLQRTKLVESINSSSEIFDPLEPKQRIIQALQIMGRLSGTVGFDKMRTIAKVD